MRLDWCKETGWWNVKDDAGQVKCKVRRVIFEVPTRTISTDGGRHGYIEFSGVITIEDDVATVRKD